MQRWQLTWNLHRGQIRLKANWFLRAGQIVLGISERIDIYLGDLRSKLLSFQFPGSKLNGYQCRHQDSFFFRLGGRGGFLLRRSKITGFRVGASTLTRFQNGMRIDADVL